MAEAPEKNKVMEAEVGGVQLCLANVDGEFSALNNTCPHREGAAWAGMDRGWSGDLSMAFLGVRCEDGVVRVSGE